MHHEHHLSVTPESAEEFDRLPDRSGTGSLKWDRYAGRDVLPMWVADMDFEVPPSIVEALHRRVDHRIFGYTRSTRSVEEAVVGYLSERHGVTADVPWIVWMPGMVPGLAMATAAFGAPGDAVATFTPVYPPFLRVHRESGRNLITVPLRRNGADYALDPEALEAAITPETRVLLLCSPHNPVGRVWREDELIAVADVCERHGLYLCSDEIHCDLLLEPERAPFTTLLKPDHPIRKRLIVLMAASKTYNIPGLGLSFAIIPDADTRRRFQLAKNAFVAETSPLGFAATEAAYRHGEPWRQRLCRYLRGNRDCIADSLARLPVPMPHIEATYLAWLDVRNTGIERPVAHFEKHGLGLSDGADFGAPGFVRLNFGCPRPLLREGLDRFRAAVEAAAGG